MPRLFPIPARQGLNAANQQLGFGNVFVFANHLFQIDQRDPSYSGPVGVGRIAIENFMRQPAGSFQPRCDDQLLSKLLVLIVQPQFDRLRAQVDHLREIFELLGGHLQAGCLIQQNLAGEFVVFDFR